MNLNPRCEKMLDNHMQCSNSSVDGSIFCLLHNEQEPERTALPTQTDTEIQKQDVAREV